MLFNTYNKNTKSIQYQREREVQILPSVLSICLCLSVDSVERERENHCDQGRRRFFSQPLGKLLLHMQGVCEKWKRKWRSWQVLLIYSLRPSHLYNVYMCTCSWFSRNLFRITATPSTTRWVYCDCVQLCWILLIPLTLSRCSCARKSIIMLLLTCHCKCALVWH